MRAKGQGGFLGWYDCEFTSREPYRRACSCILSQHDALEVSLRAKCNVRNIIERTFFSACLGAMMALETRALEIARAGHCESVEILPSMFTALQ